jgi:hypothetical protein
MSAARNTLAHVASRLNGRACVRILWGQTLELDGVPVLYANPSDALVYLPIVGAVRDLRSSDVLRGAPVEEIADSIAGRLELAGLALGRRAA